MQGRIQWRTILHLLYKSPPRLSWWKHWPDEKVRSCSNYLDDEPTRKSPSCCVYQKTPYYFTATIFAKSSDWKIRKSTWDPTCYPMIHSGYYPLFSYYLINLTLIPYTVWWSTGSGWFVRFNFHIKMGSCVISGNPAAGIACDSSVRRKCMQLTINTVIFNLFEFRFLFSWLWRLYSIDSDPWNEYNS